MDVSLCLDAARPWPDLLSLARHADESGLHAVYVPDHFGGYQEAWTLLSAVAASTEQIRLGTLVLGVTHRPVSVLREMARTLHAVSDGRLVLGIGAAWDEAEHQALSLPFPPASERLDLLDSAASQLADCGPPLLVGGGGERRTMPIAARYAAIWHAWADPGDFERKCAVMDRLCLDADRDLPAIRRATGAVLVGEDDPAAIVAAYAGAGADEFIVRDHREASVAESLAAASRVL
ncbi:MAG TPA: LLM class flavin-dependent oxidoreductase [Nocardioidaceae bacterium]|nr:LLM class flavin-dependent oxidoreductase [Nocardioidaceae bacterium]